MHQTRLQGILFNPSLQIKWSLHQKFTSASNFFKIWKKIKFKKLKKEKKDLETHARNYKNLGLIGKVPDAGKDWRQKEKRASEDKMAG